MLRRIDLRPGALLLLASLATLVAPMPGVRVHRHPGGDHVHVHLEDVGRHGHPHDGHGHFRAHSHEHRAAHATAERLGAGSHALRDETRTSEGVANPVLSASEPDEHFHTFNPFLRSLRSQSTRLAATVLAAAVGVPTVSTPSFRARGVALARGPPSLLPF